MQDEKMDALDFTITQSEWDRRKLEVEDKLREKGLEKKVKQGHPNVYHSLGDFFLTAAILAKKNSNYDGALASASYAGAKSGIARLMHGENERYGLRKGEPHELLFFGNKRIQYRTYPEWFKEAIELYYSGIEQLPGQPLELLTSHFFHWNMFASLSFLEENNLTDTLKETKQALICGKEYPLSFNEHDRWKKSGREMEHNSHSPLSLLLKENKEKNTEQNAKQNRENMIEKKIGNAKEKRILPPLHNYIAGHEKVKEAFQRIASIVKRRDYFLSYFPPEKLFTNYLLVGPPGTGKTTLSSSLSKESGLLFVPISCVELGSSYINQTAANIDAVYRDAEALLQKKEHSGIILYFDEIDHLMKKRGISHNAEDEKVVTAFNYRLQGAGTVPGTITIGSTNKPELIDEALLSRFELLHVGYPQDDEGIIAIHRNIVRKIEDYAKTKIFENVDFSRILPFSKSDERYKSGRVIDAILYKAAIRVHLHGLDNGGFRGVTTNDIFEMYRSYSFETSEYAQQNPAPFAATM